MKNIILQWKYILFIIYSYDLYRKYSDLFDTAEKQNTIYREFVKYLIKIIKEATMIEKWEGL